jgi:hypothetical protein
MSRFILDQETTRKLESLNGAVQLIGSHGKPIGIFSAKQIDPFAEIDDAEYHRRLNDSEEFTTDEVISYLNSLKG